LREFFDITDAILDPTEREGDEASSENLKTEMMSNWTTREKGDDMTWVATRFSLTAEEAKQLTFYKSGISYNRIGFAMQVSDTGEDISKEMAKSIQDKVTQHGSSANGGWYDGRPAGSVYSLSETAVEFSC